MDSTFSGWTMLLPAFTERPRQANAPNVIAWPHQAAAPAASSWEELSIEEQLNGIERLEDDWDGYGGASVDMTTVFNARQFLAALKLYPRTVLPTAAGTLVLEWQGAVGTASLEFGIDSYSFYTAPCAGRPILLDGKLQDLDAHDIGFALTTVLAGALPQSVEDAHWRRGIEVWK